MTATSTMFSAGDVTAAAPEKTTEAEIQNRGHAKGNTEKFS
jgi:hypothetical protein